MDWNGAVRDAAAYIEDNLTLSFTAKDVADHIHYSSFYFQRVFRDTCGTSVGEYVRRRRLSRAAVELVRTDIRILDLAVKYGYDSPDSFTRAFTKFHGSTPSEVRSGKVTVKDYPQLQTGYRKEGEKEMEYKLEKKQSFKVMGVSKNFDFEDAQKKIPLFWDDVMSAPDGAPVMGMYGICFDTPTGNDQFRYMIADDFMEEAAAEKGLEVIEAHFLYDMPYEKIDVVVHPQSIIHSMVEYIDNMVIAQLGHPDMSSCIRYALTYPERSFAASSGVDFAALGKLTFDRPDREVFPLLDAAIRAYRMGTTAPTALIASDEEAVSAFIDGKIRFCDISDIVCETLETFSPHITCDYNSVKDAELTSRHISGNLISKIKR